MYKFNIEVKPEDEPKQDGEVRKYTNPEAASQKEYFDENRRVVFVNGMDNSGHDHAYSALALSLVQMCPVIGVYNKTGGVWADLAQCVFDKLQFQGPLASSATDKVAARNSFWNRLLNGERTPVQAVRQALGRNEAQSALFDLLRRPGYARWPVFAHSQGNLILSNVLQGVAAVDGPSAVTGREVHTFGSPAVYYPPGVRLHEHGFTFDYVNWLSGLDATFSISKVGWPSGAKQPFAHGFLLYLKDDPEFVVNRFRTGGWGMTFNMDEQGLADCLAAMGTNMERVWQVFDHLARHHNSDVDDVAVLYVNAVRRNGAVASALRARKNLVDLLVRSMSAGWTAADEKGAIAWLKSL